MAILLTTSTHYLAENGSRAKKCGMVGITGTNDLSICPSYTIVAWISCSDMTLASLASLTAWMPSALAMAAASVVM